jgi:hypothetical protein
MSIPKAEGKGVIKNGSRRTVCQFMLVFVGGFVALYRLLVHSQSYTRSALALLGFVVTIVTAVTAGVLQAAYRIALKMAVDTWYAAAAPAEGEEKTIAIRVAEVIRWIEIGINSIFKIQAVSIIFDVAIGKSTPFSAVASEE